MFFTDRVIKQRASRQRRQGFTLVELLLVIGIIGILTSLALLVIRGAEQDARVARSTSQVQRINIVLAGEWEKYQTRILRFRFNQETGNNNLNANQIHRIRTRAMMDLARVEFPNDKDVLAQYPSESSQEDLSGGAITDISDPAYWPDIAPNEWATNYTNLMVTLEPTALLRLRNHFALTVTGTNGNGINQWDNPDWSETHEQSECLYAILRRIRIDGVSGLEYANLRPDEIGDTDNDGFPEILDSFGDPLNFVFDSPAANGLINSATPEMSLEVPFLVTSINLNGI